MKSTPPSNERQDTNQGQQNIAYPDDAIAIVGMAVRLSGGINSPEELWEALNRSKHGLCEVPNTRYNIDGFYDPKLPQSVKTRRGYYMEEDPTQFDAEFFGINPVEAEGMDPQQRQLLEVTWECLESAGQSTSGTDKNVGCYVGVFGNDWLTMDAQDSQAITRFHIAGSGPFALANRLSYCFDWHGPSVTMQTACSSSLVGLHEACQALRAGDCRSAIVGGVNLILSPTMTMAMSDTTVLAEDGACKTFDQSADGYGRGEGVAVVCVKLLSEAIKDGDNIRGIVRATATNYNGKTVIPTAPCLASQESLIRKTYDLAKIQNMHDTALFECHGTGTQAGDVIEVSAIAKALTANGSIPVSPIMLSSTKPNFGHTEGASGVVSVIKSILCLENNYIPPSIFFKTPNPRIPFESANLSVSTLGTPFPDNKAKRVSINCSGVGGSNAHAIIDAPLSVWQGTRQLEVTESLKSNLFVVSAKDEDALEIRVSNSVDYALLNGASSYADMAYTLACRRQHFAHRAFAVVNPNRPLAMNDFHRFHTRPTELVWVFTGQGSQWAGMAKQLCETSEEFRRDMETLDTALHQLDDGPDWTISDELSKLTAEGSRVHETEMAQPLCTALTIGVVNQLKRWNITPSAVIGHSSGEMAAAYASGAITAAAAIRIAYYRGIIAKSQQGKGCMTSVALGWQQVAPFLPANGSVSIACRNGPNNTVLSGPLEDLEAVTDSIKLHLPEVFCRKLRVTVPYHSIHMKEPAADFERLIMQHIEVNDTMIPMYSPSSLEKITVPQNLNAQYWSRAVASEVNFGDAIQTIFDDVAESQLVFMELGPHSALSGPLRQIFQALQDATPDMKTPIYIATLTRNDMDCTAQLLSAAGRLHCLGVPMDMQSITGLGHALSDLKTYPFRRDRILKSRESRIVRDWRLREHKHHELLGCRVSTMPDAEPAWRNLLKLGDVLWLGDHVLKGKTVWPVAAYIAMVGAAVGQITPFGQGYSIRNLSLKSFLALKTGSTVELLTTLKPLRFNDVTESEWFSFTVSSHNGKNWTIHCVGQVRSGKDGQRKQTVEQIKQGQRPDGYARRVNALLWYKLTRKLGYEYGPRLRNLESVSVDPLEAMATATIANHSGFEPQTEYVLCPTKIDQCLQLMGIASVNGVARRIHDMQVPLSIGQVYVGGGSGQMKTWVKGVNDGQRSLCWEASVTDDQSNTDILCIGNLRSVVVDRLNNTSSTIPLISSLQWQPSPSFFASRPDLLEQLELGEHRLVDAEGYDTFLRLLAHSKPSMRVMHVYASADDNAEREVRALTSCEGVRLFSSYTYSDTTNVVLDAARLQFIQDPKVQFKLFDPNGDIQRQGLEEGSFDLIIMSDADKFSLPSLKVLCRLLKPSAWIVVRGEKVSIDVASEESERSTTPDDSSSDEKWQHVKDTSQDPVISIEAAGLRVVASWPPDQGSAPTSSTVSTYICQRLDTSVSSVKKVVLLSISTPGDWAHQLAIQLKARNYQVSWATLSNPPLPGQYVIALLDLEAAVCGNLSKELFDQLKQYLLTTKAARTLWVTRSAQFACDDPTYGLIHGLIRTLRREMSMNISILELNELGEKTIQSVLDVSDSLEQSTDSGKSIQDYEFAVCDGLVHVGRYHWESPSTALNKRSNNSTANTNKRLCIPDSFLEECRWIPSQAEAKIASGDVEVEISYIGLNFRDAMIAMGLVGSPAQFGLEASGIVSRVGAGVKDLVPGDQVGILSAGICQSKLMTASHNCWKIPKDMSLETAAAILVPYLTAMYSLLHVANLQRDETVLIHSACGGVGLAAIKICQVIGAKVFATVGSEEKVQYLIEHCSIPRDNIFCSRDDSFVKDVTMATDGKGVDVVLNSLAGKLLHASWECVASFGKMIELGKIDFMTNGSLSMTPFAKNRSFIGVDLLELGSQRPQHLKRLLDEVLDWFQKKKLEPTTPLTTFEATKTSEALRFMKKGQHIGKLLLDLSSLATDTNSSDSLDSSDIHFRSDATYLLIGGLGGLGRSVATWLVEHGTRDVVFVGRSSGQSQEDTQFFEELKAQSCTSTYISGSIAEPETMKRAVQACRQPLRGILQMSAVLRDRTFQNMTYQDWAECLEPKVQGTWNLHNAIQDEKSLDFLVLFGSLAGVYGNSGQANYAAANGFLESFTQFRRRKGLACSVVNLGPVEDVGMISRDDKLLQAIKSTSVHLLSEEEMLQGLQVAIARSNCDDDGDLTGQSLSASRIVSVGLSTGQSVSDMPKLSIWTNDARFAVYSNLQTSQGHEKPQVVDNKFRSLVTKIEQEPLILNDPNTELLVCRELGRLITGYLGEDNKRVSDEDLAGIAIDSLMAIEIKDWVRGNMNMDIGMDQTSRSKTVGELARHTVQRLQVTYGLREDD